MAEEQQEDPVPQLAEAQGAAPPTSEDLKSKRVRLADLSARGNALYASKKYEEASEFFSEASNLQAEINGETARENAEILFRYGRSLFKVGQSKSNVLGGAAPAPQPASKPKSSGEASSSNALKKRQNPSGEPKSVGAEADAQIADEKKPLFQFTGDENFEGSEDEGDGEILAGDGEGDDEEPEEDEDDLSIAFEILDLARVCYLKQLDAIQTQDQTGEEKGKGPVPQRGSGNDSTTRHIKERLADTHDCLAEISLENEKYPNAIEDGRTSLNYKLELYSPDSEIIAEAHYKLSLALEFASVTTTTNAEGGQEGQDAPAGGQREDMDQGLRDEAVKEMEKAIASFRLKLQGKEVDLATMASPEENDLARKAIAEMKEVIADMDQRLVDLKAGPLDTKGLLGGDANPLGGILGAALGESASDTKARVEEAKKTANDLSGLVRKKKPKEEQPAGEGEGEASQHKRKASATGQPGSPKKAKVDDE